MIAIQRQRRAGPSPLFRLYRLGTTLLLPFNWVDVWRKKTVPPGTVAKKMAWAGEPRPPGKLLMVVCSLGLGEQPIVRPILEWIRAEWPELTIVVAPRFVYGTKKHTLALPAGTLMRCGPFNAPAPIRRFNAQWRPDFVLWIGRNPTPNFVYESGKYGTGHAVLWGVVTDEAYAKYGRLASLYRDTYAAVPFVAARSKDDAERYRNLGAGEVTVPGDLRNCVPALAADPAVLEALRAEIGGRPCWVAASIRDDEYKLVAQLHRRLAARHPTLLTIAVPRYPQEGEGIARTLRADGFTIARRAASEPLDSQTQIYIADTFGELGLWYRLCPIAVVGGTFAPYGGHNVLEPARLGCAVLCGPDVRNIAALVAEMVEAGALIQVNDEAALGEALAALFEFPDRLAQARAAAAAYAQRSAMTFDRLFDAARPHLERALGPSARA
jgi:3-deoxy-D-manno-octulosonic-acid transferase